jgi:hypothetical protein
MVKTNGILNYYDSIYENEKDPIRKEYALLQVCYLYKKLNGFSERDVEVAAANIAEYARLHKHDMIGF